MSMPRAMFRPCVPRQSRNKPLIGRVPAQSWKLSSPRWGVTLSAARRDKSNRSQHSGKNLADRLDWGEFAQLAIWWVR
jgi:hypothetical protein